VSTSNDVRVLGAACDLAVVRALELIGKRCVRADRARYGTLARAGLVWHEAHTVWKPEPDAVDAALSGAWAILPRLVNEHGCCQVAEPALQATLDAYVRELVASSTPHRYADLEERLRALAD
jgi:hypothetical protein